MPDAVGCQNPLPVFDDGSTKSSPISSGTRGEGRASSDGTFVESGVRCYLISVTLPLNLLTFPK